MLLCFSAQQQNSPLLLHFSCGFLKTLRFSCAVILQTGSCSAGWRQCLRCNSNKCRLMAPEDFVSSHNQRCRSHVNWNAPVSFTWSTAHSNVAQTSLFKSLFVTRRVVLTEGKPLRTKLLCSFGAAKAKKSKKKKGTHSIFLITRVKQYRKMWMKTYRRRKKKVFKEPN